MNDKEIFSEIVMVSTYCALNFCKSKNITKMDDLFCKGVGHSYSYGTKVSS